MKRSLVFLALFLSVLGFSALAHADGGGCIEGQRSSTNKTLHLIGTALVTFGVAVQTDNIWYGLGAGVVAGGAREIQKIVTPGMRCEWWSQGYDLAGIIIGGSGAYWKLSQTPHGGPQVSWSRSF